MIKVEIDPKAISAAMEDERILIARRVRLATEKAGRQILLEPLRDMTRQAFQSRKLPTTWRGQIYPKDSSSTTLSPAYYVHSKAPEIISAFEEGVTITAQNKRFLAIPTIESGRHGRHFRRGALTPEKWVKENGVQLHFRPTRSGGVLVATDQRFRTRKRRGKKSQPFTVKRQKPIVVFILVKQVRLSKRLDIAGLAARVGAEYRNSMSLALNGG